MILFAVCLSAFATNPFNFKREDSGENYLGRFQLSKLLEHNNIQLNTKANLESHATDNDMAALWLLQVMRDFEQEFDKARRKNSLMNNLATGFYNNQ